MLTLKRNMRKYLDHSFIFYSKMVPFWLTELHQISWICHICIRVIEFLRNFEFRNWHTMRGGLMLPDSISEEKLEID